GCASGPAAPRSRLARDPARPAMRPGSLRLPARPKAPALLGRPLGDESDQSRPDPEAPGRGRRLPDPGTTPAIAPDPREPTGLVDHAVRGQLAQGRSPALPGTLSRGPPAAGDRREPAAQ